MKNTGHITAEAGERWWIGIDPDVDGHGVAGLSSAGRVAMFNLPLAGTVSLLRAMHSYGLLACCVVEGGWLNRGQWHLRAGITVRAAAETGCRTGRNHQCGIDLCECLTAVGVPHTVAKPLPKCWRAGKVSHQELERQLTAAGIDKTQIPGKTNQEQRDAMLLALVQYNNRVKPCKRKKP